jgi:NAD(P)-dependent dehydrogenase (short-subunit alcohol dehydrogenase family)
MVTCGALRRSRGEVQGVELGLEDKVAVVTGSSKGIGKAIALELAREGCRVVLTARGEKDLEEAAEDVRRTGSVGDVLAVAADVTKADEVERLIDATVARFGTIDVLVNNAGGTGRRSPFHELSDEEWFEILDLNLISAVRLTRAVLPHMRRQRWGRIINVASESGSQPSTLKPHYNAAKAALINLTKSLSKAYGEYGILVNAVSPATTITPAVEDLMAEEARRKRTPLNEREAAFVRENKPDIVAGRLGRPEETAWVVAFLASGRASFVTGANYRVDGGSVTSIS